MYHFDGDAAVRSRANLVGHAIVADEGGGLQVLDPFGRDAEHDRGDDRANIARIYANLAAKAGSELPLRVR